MELEKTNNTLKTNLGLTDKHLEIFANKIVLLEKEIKVLELKNRELRSEVAEIQAKQKVKERKRRMKNVIQ